MAKYTHYKTLAIVLIVPQLIVTFVFFIWPAARAMLGSFFFSDAFGVHRQYAGFANYLDLFHSPDYVHALLVTLLMACSVTFVTMVSGLLFAVLVQNCRRGQGVYKSLLLWPYAVAPAVAAILWRFLCQPGLGWVSNGLRTIGIDFNYLIHPWQALAVIIVTASWQQFSYNFLFFLGALRGIPKSLMEAAILDGASGWRRFWQIIFPLLSPTTFFLLVMNLVYGFFETFGIIDVLTHGGPENQTTTMVYKVYKDGFTGMDPGSSAAQSVLLMLMITGVTLLQFFWLEKKVHYL